MYINNVKKKMSHLSVPDDLCFSETARAGFCVPESHEIKSIHADRLAKERPLSNIDATPSDDDAPIHDPKHPTPIKAVGPVEILARQAKRSTSRKALKASTSTPIIPANVPMQKQPHYGASGGRSVRMDDDSAISTTSRRSQRNNYFYRAVEVTLEGGLGPEDPLDLFETVTCTQHVKELFHDEIKFKIDNSAVSGQWYTGFLKEKLSKKTSPAPNTSFADAFTDSFTDATVTTNPDVILSAEHDRSAFTRPVPGLQRAPPTHQVITWLKEMIVMVHFENSTSDMKNNK